jgi:hypothetical protein
MNVVLFLSLLVSIFGGTLVSVLLRPYFFRALPQRKQRSTIWRIKWIAYALCSFGSPVFLFLYLNNYFLSTMFQGQQQIIVLTYIFSVAISTIIQFSRFKRRNPIEYATIWENRYYNDSDGMKTGDMFKLLLVAQLIIFGFIALMVIRDFWRP